MEGFPENENDNSSNVSPDADDFDPKSRAELDALKERFSDQYVGLDDDDSALDDAEHEENQ